MNRSIVIIAMAAAMGAAAMADGGETPASPGAPRRLKHPLRAGGFLQKRGPGLPLVFLDMRGESATDVSPVVADMQAYSRLAIDVEAAEAGKGADALGAALALKRDGKASAVVAIANGGDAPALTVCPEDNVAAINIDRLTAGLPDEGGAAVLDKRLCKELWRAVALALGGYTSHDPCVMKPVAGTEDLDDLEMRMFCPVVNEKVDAAAAKAGVARMMLVPYGMAVKQGWAPPPTNDLQRAVWEELRAAAATDATDNAPAPAAK